MIQERQAVLDPKLITNFAQQDEPQKSKINIIGHIKAFLMELCGWQSSCWFPYFLPRLQGILALLNVFFHLLLNSLLAIIFVAADNWHVLPRWSVLWALYDDEFCQFPPLVAFCSLSLFFFLLPSPMSAPWCPASPCVARFPVSVTGQRSTMNVLEVSMGLVKMESKRGLYCLCFSFLKINKTRRCLEQSTVQAISAEWKGNDASPLMARINYQFMPLTLLNFANRQWAPLTKKRKPDLEYLMLPAVQHMVVCSGNFCEQTKNGTDMKSTSPGILAVGPRSWLLASFLRPPYFQVFDKSNIIFL